MPLKKIIKNMIKTFIIGIVILFAGLIITFILMNLLPIDPVLAFLPPMFTPEQYQAMAHSLGYDEPLIIQFFIFLGNFFTGNWCRSSNILPGLPVTDLLVGSGRLQRTFEVLLLPLIVGAIAGILIGLISIKTRKKWLKRIIQILNVLGYAVPVIFLAFFFQFGAYLSGNLPPSGFKSAAYPDPPFVTGFRIWDSILAGRWDLAFDTALHYILPGLVLGFTISALVVKLVRINAVNKSQKTSIIYNTARIALIFGLIFGYAILVGKIFNLSEFGNIFVQALQLHDYFVIQACLFVVIITIVLVTFAANIIYSIYHHMVEKEIWPTTWIRKEKGSQKESLNEVGSNVEKERNPTRFKDFKTYFLRKLKSPLTIIGLIFFLFFVVISIVPQIITPYSLTEAVSAYPDPWALPSPGHPFGTGYQGRDILALVVYGIQDSLIFGFLTVLIGIGGGLLFGYLANNRYYENKFYRWFGRWVIMGFLLLFYILPFFFLIPVISTAFGLNYLICLIIIGVLLIPLFTWIFVRTEYKIFKILKKLIIYIPLFVGFTISIYISLGFLGFYDHSILHQLGKTISDGSGYIAPWTTLIPGIALFLLLLGLFLIYEGFQDYPRHSR
ncbi:MAG: hypothetical protein ACFFDX_13395 [Candidatus Odinarchaeota archaeon]